MWDRKELKAKGKVAFKRNYWRCVLVSFVLALVTGGAGASSGVSSGATNGIKAAGENIPPEVLMVVAIAFSIVAIAGTALGIFLFSVIQVGCCRYYLVNSEVYAGPSLMGYAFREGRYGRTVLTMFLMGLYEFLWSLLFIIPGIIKAYAYRMTPYIRAEFDDLTANEAITLSRQMMDGNKWRAFVFDLSFIGWEILNALTFGILGLFFVNPYFDAAKAELYKAIKEEYFAKQNGYAYDGVQDVY